MSVSLRIAEPAGRHRRDLRRFTFSTHAKCPHGWGHDATVTIGEISDAEAERVHGDNWPHDDPRWPKTCEHCGYEFRPEDEWQRNDCRIYTVDGTEFAWWGDPGKSAPAGTMIRADWYDDFTELPGESWLVVLPDGGTWISTQKASGGGYWEVTGTPPHITVSPSIFHNAPHGWHGFIRGGVLVDA